MNYHETPLTGLRSKRDTVSIRPSGVDAVRAAIAKGLAKLDQGDPLEIARGRWGDAWVEKADVPALTTTGSPFITSPSGNLSHTAQFFAAVDARSLPAQLPGIRRVPFHTAGLGISAGAPAYWVSEGGAVPSTQFTANRTPGLVPFKICAIQVVTEEALRDSDPKAEAVITEDLLNSAALLLNRSIIDPASVAVAGTNPASVTDGAGASDSPAGLFNDFDDIVEGMITNQDFEGDLTKSVLVMHPSMGARLSNSSRQFIGSRGGQVAGFPAITNIGVPTNLVVLLDSSALMFAGDDTGEISVSTQASLEMKTNPTVSSLTPTPTNLVSLFSDNSVALLVTLRASWAMAKPNCVSYVEIQVG